MNIVNQRNKHLLSFMSELVGNSMFFFGFHQGTTQVLALWPKQGTIQRSDEFGTVPCHMSSPVTQPLPGTRRLWSSPWSALTPDVPKPSMMCAAMGSVPRFWVSRCIKYHSITNYHQPFHFSGLYPLTFYVSAFPMIVGIIMYNHVAWSTCSYVISSL